MDTARVKIEDAKRGMLAPSNGGAVVLDMLSKTHAGRAFWYDTDGGRLYETGGCLTVYASPVRTQHFGRGRGGKNHALVPQVKGETPRGVCADSQGMELAVWESGAALAAVTCGGCRLSIGLAGPLPREERPATPIDVTDVRYEVDGETVTGGKPGEVWHAVYRVPSRLVVPGLTKSEAEEFGAPRFERMDGCAPVGGRTAAADAADDCTLLPDYETGDCPTCEAKRS